MIKFIQKQMNKDGFTLVELIIVIAVMAILAAIVVPKMAGVTTSFKLKSDERICDNLAREIEVKIQLGTQATEGATAGSVLSGTAFSIMPETPTPKSVSGQFYYYIDNTYVTVYASTAIITTFTNGVPTGASASITKKHGGKIE